MSTQVYSTDSWRAARGSWDGADYLLRTRESLPEVGVRVRWNQVVFVRWTFAKSVAGMPSPEDNERCLAFEQAVDAHLTRVGLGVLVAVVTGNGAKEWRFYTHTHDDFMHAFNAALVGHERYPLEIESFVDDEWRALSELLG